MRTRQVFRAFLSFAVVVGLICILYINVSQNFLKQKEQLVKDSILEKGIDIVDDFRKNDETRILKKEKVKGLAKSGVSVESASGKLGIADTRGKPGVVDTRDKEDVVDTRDKEGVVNTLGKEGVVKTRDKDDVVDTREKDGVVDTRDKEGVVNTRGKDGVVNTRDKEGVVNTRGKEGVVDTRAKDGVVDTRDKESVVDTRGKENVVDTRAKEGVVDTRAKEGMVDTRDKEGVVNTLGKEGVVKTRDKDDVVDTREKDGVVDTRNKEGVVNTRGIEGVVDTLAKEGVVDTRNKEGEVNTRGKEGVVDSRGTESVLNILGKGVVDKYDKEGAINTHWKEGTVGARMKEYVVDTRAKEDVVDTRREESVVNTHGKKSVVDTADKEDKANTNGGANMNIRSDEVLDSTNSAIKENPKPRRQSLLMIGHDRSGTTFINRMFNEDPNVFNVYEPLWITKGIGPPEKHQEVIIDTMNGILNCNFSATKNGITFLAKISQWIAVRLNSKAMMSHPFCKIKNGERVCENMPPKLADEVCATSYKYSVTKLAVTRIPNKKISSILRRLLDENPHTRVLYMLRDPRGTINSRINLGWMKEYPDPVMQNGVKSVCETTAYNLRYMQIVMNESEYRERCMIIRYKDISANPLAIAKKIYNFARFQIEPRLTDWIMNHTNPSKEKLKFESYNHYSVVRNATGNADKWRKEAPVERVRIINKLCSPLLRLLGISD